MRIVHITDIHLHDDSILKYNVNPLKNLERILLDTQGSNIDRVIITGDLGDHENFHFIDTAMKKAGIEYDFVLGNHDEYANYKVKCNLDDSMEGLYFYRKVNSDIFIYLDSSLTYIDDKQIIWLKETLRNEEFRRILIFLHHPILDCGKTSMDILYPLTNRI